MDKYYFNLDKNKCKLIKGAKGAAIYDFQSGSITPVSFKYAGNLRCDVDSFEFRSASEAQNDQFIKKLKFKRLGSLSRLPNDITQNTYGSFEAKPDFAWLEITSQCNLRCIHCYGAFGNNLCMKDKNELLSLEDWMNVIGQVAEFGFKRIQFIGGEPLCYSHFNELLFEARRYDFSFIEVFSNLLLLDEKTLNDLLQNDASLATTVYSVNKEVHDEITGQVGSFDTTIRNIRLATSWGIPVRVSCIATNVNENRIGDIKVFVESLGAYFSGIDQVRPSGRGDNAMCRTTIPDKRICQPQFTSKESFAAGHTFNPCWKGKLVVTEDGSIIPCVFARCFVAGYIKENSLSKIIHDPNGLAKYWQFSKDKIRVCKDCEFRYACSDCRPLAVATNKGDLEAKTHNCAYDPYSCKWS